jgi:hypothetical protein
MKPFIAKIGPPRVLLGVLALAYAVLSTAFDVTLRGNIEWERYIEEMLAFVVGVFNIGQEVVKGYFRNRFTIVEMDKDGLFDRRIMKQRLAWEDIEWIDPHPGGLPDRLRLVGKAELTTFGKLRNFLIRTIRQLPRGEIAITFGGLNKAGAQAANWLAENKPGFVPDVWKTDPRAYNPQTAIAHGVPFIRASVFAREWVGAFAIGILIVALLAALLPAILSTNPFLHGFSESSKLMASIVLMLLAILVFSGATGLLFWYHKRFDEQLIVISETGISDVRVSTQFISWQNVESVIFEYRDMGRLINEARPVIIQVREGFALTPPKPRLFRAIDLMRRLSTPELITLRHQGTTTSVSEIIETIQRHELPVAIREVARG